MPSPFPGMNPYLEHPDVWSGFHNKFVTNFREAIVSVAGPKYHVRVVHEPYYSAEELAEEVAYESVQVVENPSVVTEGAMPLPIQVTIPPIMLDHISALEIVDPAARERVTVIELLSLVNKTRERNFSLYRARRSSAFISWPHFVEIDLLRAGRRMPWRYEPQPLTYSVAVSPRQDRPHVGFWPIQLRDPLPTIPIPLGVDDFPVPVDLQAILHRTYDEGGYAQHIYLLPPEPPLAPDDAAWAADIARAATPAG